MSLIHIFTRRGLLAAYLLLGAPLGLAAADAEPEAPAEAEEAIGADAEADAEIPSDPEELMAPDSEGESEDMVDRIVFRDETTDQVLDLLERLTGRSIIRPQALPSATFTFNSQQPMTRDEAIIALQSMLSINGIGVTPMGDLFLKVVPLTRLQSEAPEFIDGSTLDLPASGRVVSRMIPLDFLSLEEVQTQLNLMITQNGGSLIPFPKANSILVTDTVSNLQAIEKLLGEMDQPFTPRTETNFYPIQYARATELVGQIQALAGTEGAPELSDRTVVTADERSNQVILVADSRQVPYFERLIEKLDVQAELVTQNEVVFLKHANSVDVASILSQLAGGPAMGGSGSSSGSGSGSGSRSGSDSSSRFSSGQSGSGSSSRSGSGSSQRNRSGSSVPQIPGVRAQQADDGGGSSGEGSSSAEGGQSAEGSLSLEAAEEALGEVASTVSGSDFSEQLSILPDERSNAIIISGTKQDIQLITDLIEKIDVILAQVRIDVFIAEVSLTESDGRGIDELGLEFSEWNTPSVAVEGPGYSITRDGIEWEMLFDAAKSRREVEILSTPTLVTTHNKQAKIIVGESRPVITGTISDGSFQGGSIRSQVQMMDIAIELEVTPLIGQDGTIQLEIFQKVDDAGEDVMIDGNPQPTIIRREAESFVSVSDGEIVILGGLQRTRGVDSKDHLGILGQIPVLGSIFSSSRDETIRQELLVFIRPTVLPTTGAAHEDAVEQIDQQSKREQIRHRMDPEEHPDPKAEEEEDEVRPRLWRRRGAGGRW